MIAVLKERPFLRLTMAGIWMMLQENYTFSSFVTGFLLATFVFAFLAAPVATLPTVQVKAAPRFFRWLAGVVRLTLYFIWELIKSNQQVGLLILKPKLDLKPGIIAMELKGRSSEQIALLSVLITLTPGTLVVEVSEKRDRMYIHCIDASDPDGALEAPRRFEELIMEVVP